MVAAAVAVARRDGELPRAMEYGTETSASARPLSSLPDLFPNLPLRRGSFVEL